MAEESVRRNGNWGLLITMALLFLLALAYLFSLRFESGDFLPAYSSLRRDPMGTAVLFESLRESGLLVERNHQALSKAVLRSGDTLLIVGYNSGWIDALAGDSTRKAVTDFVEEGGRLIIAYSPLFSNDQAEDDDDICSESPAADEQGGAEDKENDDQADPEMGEIYDMKGNESGDQSNEPEEEPPVWAISIAPAAEGVEGDSAQVAVGSLDGERLAVGWQQPLVFEDPDLQWQVILTLGGEPVLMERQVGKGTVVLSTSSSFLSNEAMLRDRQVPLLTWLVGRAERLIFDEYHHGLQSRGSIIGLVRSYDLHGVIILLFFLVALFLWKNSSSLLPRHGQDSGQVRFHAGRDQFEGLVNILRRHPPDNLLSAALDEWEKGNRKWCRSHPDKIREMRELARRESKKKGWEEQQVARYQAICRILNSENLTITNNHE